MANHASHEPNAVVDIADQQMRGSGTGEGAPRKEKRADLEQ